MQVVRGKSVVEMGAEEARALLNPYDHLVADVGTGDGRFPYALAREHPATFFVGIDANADNLREVSHKAARKPSKGGLPNVAYVLADAEDPPDALAARADTVHVVLPWGKLMVGLLLASPGVLGGLARLARPGADLHVILNGEVWSDPVPIDQRDLPDPTPAFVAETLAPLYSERAGIVIDDVRAMPADAAHAIPSTWAKKLRHGRPAPRFTEFFGRFGSTPAVALREPTDTDLPVLFEQQRDPASNAMAAVPGRDRDAFDAHWRRLLADPTVTIRVIDAGGEVVGSVLTFMTGDERDVGYWIAREHWGRGLASAALGQFLADEVHERPLRARVASHNGGSIRVLEKSGFVSERREQKEDVEELVMRLDG